MQLPRFIPRAWLGPRRNQATQGDHRHLIGDDKTGYISMPLFNGEAPVDTDELVAILESYGLDGSAFTGGGGGGVTDHGALTGLADDDHTQYALITDYFTRTDTVITTASLAPNATENGSVTLAAGYRLMTLDVDRACRVRLYTSSAKRTSDAARAIGTDIDIATDHGLMFEYIADAAINTDLSPLVDGYCPTGTTVYYAIENRSVGSSTVEVTLTWIRTD